MMRGEELVQRCRLLALEQAAFQGSVRLASPLKEGEDVDSGEAEDADHWVAVYSELLEFKQDLLREIERQTREMSEQAARLASSNHRAFLLELRRLELHLEYWRARREELRKRATYR